jgi:hypothetical protein
MEIRQLELDLWQSLDAAVRYPETANVQRLCDALEGAIAAHPVQDQLQRGSRCGKFPRCMRRGQHG